MENLKEGTILIKNDGSKWTFVVYAFTVWNRYYKTYTVDKNKIWVLPFDEEKEPDPADIEEEEITLFKIAE